MRMKAMKYKIGTAMLAIAITLIVVATFGSIFMSMVESAGLKFTLYLFGGVIFATAWILTGFALRDAGRHEKYHDL